MLTNATRDVVQFVRRNTNTKEMNTHESKEKKIEEKVREKG